MEKNNLPDTSKPGQEVNKSGLQPKPAPAKDAAGNYQTGKGTGMSSEAGAEQSEQSWQDTGGSQANANGENPDESSLRNKEGNNS